MEPHHMVMRTCGNLKPQLFNAVGTVVLLVLCGYVIIRIRGAYKRKESRNKSLRAALGQHASGGSTVTSYSHDTPVSKLHDSVDHSNNGTPISVVVGNDGTEDVDAHAASLQGHVSELLVFPIYFTFLKLACVLYALRAIFCFFILIGVSSHVERVFAFFAALILHPFDSALSEGLTFFLCLRSAGHDAIGRTWRFIVLWTLPQVVYGVVLWATSKKEGKAMAGTVPNFYSHYWTAIYAVRFAFYLAVCFYILLQGLGRKTVYPYLAFQFPTYLLSIIGNAMLYHHTSGAECLLVSVWSLWIGLWAPITYFVLRKDSEYWQSPVASSQFDSLEEEVSVSSNNAFGSQVIKPLLSSPIKNKQVDESFVIPFGDLVFGPLIGEGGTARVYKGRYQGRTVAIKLLEVHMLTKENIRQFVKEYSLASRLKHPNVVTTHGVCIVPPDICLVTEFMHRGSLFRLLGKSRLTLDQRVRMAVDCARGVRFLHTQRPPVIHRDLKSLNLLVNNKYKLKLADLGEARELPEADTEHMTSERGTPHWMAPELFESHNFQNYTEKVDIYSMGIVLWEIASDRRPYEGMSKWMIPGAVVDQGMRPPLDAIYADIPEKFVSIMRSCWDADPSKRPTAEQLVEDLSAVKAAVVVQAAGDRGRNHHESKEHT